MKNYLLYDDHCSLCLKTANFLIPFFQNSNIKLIALSEFLKDQELQKFSLEEVSIEEEQLRKEIHLIYDGIIYSSEKAIEVLIQNLPHLKPAIWKIKSLILKKSALPAYKLMKTLKRVCASCQKTKRALYSKK